jgi:lipoprotein NlpD
LKPLAANGATDVESLGPAADTVAEGGGVAAATEVPAPAADKVPTLSEPRATTLPWSEKALAQLGGDAAATRAAPERGPEARADSRGDAKPDARTEPKPESKADAKVDAKADPKPDARPAVKPEAATAPRQESRPEAKPAAGTAPVPPAAARSPEVVATGDDWVWPARGALAYRFGDSGALKGLGIAGKAGSPVVAAAPGRVVYSGAGLRGYGKLVIIKHSEEYLTVYAHNRALLVKEGEQVRRGQRIAEMGDTDSDRVALHFELRRFGKPVDPLSQLPGDRPPS